MRGRYIGENILELTTIEYCNKHQINALIISFDFEKAFDKVEWSVLNGMLKFVNFGPNIRSWIKILQTDMQTAVLNNGYTSEWFNITRSVRQGDLISSFLFLILIETFGIKLRANNIIKRVWLNGNYNAKLHSQYADDIWAAIKYELESLN